MDKTLEPLPYFKWLWRDWRANRRVQKLNYVARGLYRELLDEQWSEGSIPSDPSELADICDCPVEVIEEHWSKLSQFFQPTENGRLINDKLEQQRTAEDSKRAALARNGRRGAVAKAKQMPAIASDPEINCHIAEQSRAVAEQSISKQEPEANAGGQENDMNLKALKTGMAVVAARYGTKTGGYDTSWEAVKILERAWGSGAVLNDYEAFLKENRGDDYPIGSLVKYLKVASDRLAGESEIAATLTKDPQVVDLVRDLTYLSGDKVTFHSKQKVEIATLLTSYEPGELLSVFSTFIEDKDLTDAYTLKYISQNFLDAADGLAYSARRRKKEAFKQAEERELTVKRLQEEAEANRLAAEAVKAEEEAAFDPLA